LANYIIMEEFHLTVSAPPDLPKRGYDAIVRALDDPRLHVGLRRAVRELFSRHPGLRPVKVRLTR
jgi:hypothetical protein